MTPTQAEILARRRYPRRNFRRKIGVLLEGQYFVLEGLEVGEGGIAFSLEKSSTHMTVGKLLVLTFRMPGGHFISVRAEVRNDAPVGEKQTIGCSFQNLAFEARREIRSYVSARKEYGN